jgi:hypothetical protein
MIAGRDDVQHGTGRLFRGIAADSCDDEWRNRPCTRAAAGGKDKNTVRIFNFGCIIIILTTGLYI